MRTAIVATQESPRMILFLFLGFWLPVGDIVFQYDSRCCTPQCGLSCWSEFGGPLHPPRLTRQWAAARTSPGGVCGFTFARARQARKDQPACGELRVCGLVSSIVVEWRQVTLEPRRSLVRPIFFFERRFWWTDFGRPWRRSGARAKMLMLDRVRFRAGRASRSGSTPQAFRR
jgi:hypothetical protein